MSYWLEPAVQQYFGVPMGPSFHSRLPGTAEQQKQQQQELSHDEQFTLELRAAATAAFSEDPALSFMLQLDSILEVRRTVVTCLATVRRNVYHFELLYLQRFKQIAEPVVRHPKSKEQTLFCLDPKTLRCGQQILVKVQLRRSPTEPLQLLREFSVLKASGSRDPAVFPRAYLFGCLGDDLWNLASADTTDGRVLAMHKRHFLLCQYVEESLQGLLDTNRANGLSLPLNAMCHLARDMLSRLKHLHSFGWSHGDLRPSCFLVNGSLDELLLSEFTSATPLSQDCLKFNEHRDQRHPVWRSERFVNCGIFADLESLVYIMCALTSPVPFPWESCAMNSVDIRSKKLALWQFAEATESEVKANLWTPAAEIDGGGCLAAVFNSASPDEASEHPACKLAAAVIRMYLMQSDNSAPAAAAATAPVAVIQLPDYTMLFASMREYS